MPYFDVCFGCRRQFSRAAKLHITWKNKMLGNPYLRRDVWISIHVVDYPDTETEVIEERHEQISFTGDGKKMKEQFDKVLEGWDRSCNVTIIMVASIIAIASACAYIGVPWLESMLGIMPSIALNCLIAFLLTRICLHVWRYVFTIRRQKHALQCSIELAPFTLDDDFVEALKKADPISFDRLEELEAHATEEAQFNFTFIQKVGSER